MFSGMLGVGKDTTAVAVWDLLGTPPERRVRVAFADPLKREVAHIVGRCAQAESPSEAVWGVEQILAVEGVHDNVLAARLVSRIFDPARTPVGLPTKSTVGRWALTTVGQAHRAKDPFHWANMGASRIREALSGGALVCVTDARFSQELALCHDTMNGFMVHLTVEPSEQAARVWARDRTVVTAAMRTDVSETDADRWGQWDCVVDTTHLTPEEVAGTVVSAWSGHAAP